MLDSNISEDITFAASAKFKEMDYWLNRLSGEWVKSSFPFDFGEARDKIKTEAVKLKITGDSFRRLTQLSKGSDHTLHLILISALILLIHKYTAIKDIIIGTPIYRQKKEGSFLNTILTLRSNVVTDITFKELLLQVRQTVQEAVENQNFPIEILIHKLKLSHSGEGFPLFDIIALLESIHDRRYIEHIPVNILFAFFKTDAYIDINLEYNIFRYKKTTAERIVNHFHNLITSVLTDINITLNKIDILSENEKQLLLIDFNANQKKFPANRSVHHFIDDQVEKNADQSAIIFENHWLTFRHLGEKVNRLISSLHKFNIRKDQGIGILLDRSQSMIESILAVWRVGGAYIPIDPSFPVKRVSEILNDSGAPILITHSRFDIPGLEETYKGKILRLDHLELRHSEEKPISVKIDPKKNMQSLAYIIFTSGSTGKPKGVMIEHRGMMNHIHAKIDILGLDEKDIVAQNASHTFDISIWQFFSALLIGGKTAIYTNDLVAQPDLFLTQVIKDQVTILEVVPSYLAVILDLAMEEYIPLPLKLNYLLVTGEEVKSSLLKKWFKTFPHIMVVNAYGPTEASDDITHHIMDKVPDLEKIPIGKPLENLAIYIIDEAKNLCPVGVKGEIRVGGIGVGRGYLNDVEKTDNLFLEDVFSQDKEYRLFNTGDMGRWLDDGVIEFHGRIDQQVKLRGFRIELEEIENKLIGHVDVNEAVVVVKQRGNEGKYLCAYIVSNNTLNVSDLREYLTGSLPGYMVPDYFVELDTLPLTVNGKVDRKVLKEGGIGSEMEFAEYAAPEDEIEQKLASIWSQLLGVEENTIGLNANFFQLGGHSLDASIMVTKIHREFNIRLPITEIFRSPTLGGLAGYLKKAVEEKYVFIEASEEKNYYELSSPQKRMYIIQQIDPESIIYNMTQPVILEGEVDLKKFEQVFHKIIMRHESFRTSFEMIDGQPVQKIHDRVDFEIEYYDFSEQIRDRRSSVRQTKQETQNSADRQVESHDEMAKEMQFSSSISKLGEINRESKIVDNAIRQFVRPFNLSEAPLIRVGVMKLAEKRFILLVDVHHIITDAISMQIVRRESRILYAGLELPRLRLQYRDYSQWENDPKVKEWIESQGEYWVNEFNNEIPVINLPTDYPRPTVQSYEGNIVAFNVGEGGTDRLNRFALQHETTLYMLLLGAFNVFLGKVTGQEDIVVGTLTAGRRHADLDNIVGIFINTLVIRCQPMGARLFNEFLSEVKEKSLKAFENQDYPFDDLVNKLKVKRSLNRNPMFDVLFALLEREEDVDVGTGEDRFPLSLSYENPQWVSRFDMTLTVTMLSGELGISIEYSTKLFKRSTIERFISFYQRIISIVLTDPSIRISDIEIISERERRQILHDFNDTMTDYPCNKTIHELFIEQTLSHPHHVGVVFEERFLTYGELNSKSSQWAAVLHTEGLKVNQPVAIIAHRSIELIIALIATLKSGAAYMPINTEFPEERKKIIINDSHAEMVLTDNSSSKENRYGNPIKILDFGEIDFKIKDSSHNPLQSIHLPQADADNLAYIIYTSGSTDRPKGVVVEHRNVVRLVKETDYVEFNETDKLLQTGALEFDASTFEIWGSLLNGICLYLISNEKILAAESLKQAILRYGISMIWMTAPLFNQMLQTDIEIFSGLKNLLVGGDVLSPFFINQLKERYPELRVTNGYGPTENTTFSTTFLIDEEYQENIPIGKPIANSTAYIIDRYDHIQPVGIYGELIAGGDGVSRGYLNDPELTGERFVLSEFYSSRRIYKTGDFARWLPTGTIEFLGRVDDQVKIRGFRIELSEIERELLKHPLVRDVAVLARGDKQADKYICAYIVPGSETGSEQAAIELRKHLTHTVPDYMVPAYFVFIKEIPLTPNGKINRSILPEPTIELHDDFILPESEEEKKLARLWSEILEINRDSIGINSNFFELGGHSLKATSLISYIQKEFNIKLPILDIFKSPTIREMASLVQVVDWTSQKESNDGRELEEIIKI